MRRRATHDLKRQAGVHVRNGRWAKARNILVQVCEANKADIESWIGLMHAHLQVGDFRQARACGEHVLQIQPRAYEVMLNLGGLHAAEGGFDLAEQYCQRAIGINPQFPGSYFNLGNALKSQGRFAEAVDAYREALRLDPKYAEATLNLGVSLKELGQYEDAVSTYRDVLRLNPRSLKALHNLGSAYTSMGQVDDAIACLRELLEIEPTFIRGFSNLLFTLNNSPLPTPRDLFAEHRLWGKMVESRYKAALTHGNQPDPERRLRIGCVSPDLRGQHSVTYFFEPLLRCHDRGQIEFFVYSESPFSDSTSERLGALCAGWRTTSNRSEEQVAADIRSDGIDILVDLAGHTARSRLSVFALKPAPIQVSYLGYPNTTGLSTLDYRLTDAIADPPGQTDRYYTEKLVRMDNGFLCYLPPPEAPNAENPPCLKNGHVTFGSFNSIAKVTPEVISLWAGILNAIPKSAIILKSHALADTKVKERYLGLFSKHGINPHRIRLLGQIPDRSGHLDLYHDIDIALDPFPYNGTTTTCEALLMGVPVISLIGQSHAGRVGLSLLSRTGISELAAKSDAEYRELACVLAQDTQRIATLRRTLRQRLLESPLCEGGSFAHTMEQTFREMWRIWCAAQQPSGRRAEP